MIRLFDSVRGEVRNLTLRRAGHVSMYVCGPTVDNLPHIGHGRFSLVWDVARRWFTFEGLSVHYVMNVTDVDDKIIARARAESRSETDVVRQYEGEWWDAMERLGVAAPDDTPHATDYIGDMVELIASFLERDVAYVDQRRRLLRRVLGPGLRAAGRPASREPSRGRSRRGQRREALAARLRALEEREARRAAAGRRPLARADRAGTPSAS